MALGAPVLLMVVGMGVEVGHWASVKARLQRTADAAALGGAVEYALAQNAANAANAAADVAVLNGMAGVTPRSWVATDETAGNIRIIGRLKADPVTVEVTTTTRTDPNTGVEDVASGVRVTAVQTVPLALTRLLNPSGQSIAVGARGWAELGGGPQPCLLALDPNAAKNPGISAQGNSSVDLVEVGLTGCSIRSNASISTQGNATMKASAFYAGTSISSVGITGPRYENVGVISDPYADHAPIQAAFARLNSGSGQSYDGTSSLSPGTIWAGWTISGNVTLAPGIYYVKGDIAIGDRASLSGTGVTIVTSGTLNAQGGAKVSLSAAKEGEARGDAIPGIVFAGTSTGESTIVGKVGVYLTGVFYTPKGPLVFGGSAHDTSNGCLQLIAASVTLKGSSSLVSKCQPLGTRVFGGSAAGSKVALVQ